MLELFQAHFWFWEDDKEPHVHTPWPHSFPLESGWEITHKQTRCAEGSWSLRKNKAGQRDKERPCGQKRTERGSSGWRGGGRHLSGDSWAESWSLWASHAAVTGKRRSGSTEGLCQWINSRQPIPRWVVRNLGKDWVGTSNNDGKIHTNNIQE